jgi:inorganic pyrophosphatase
VKVTSISPFEGDHINAIVETPLGSGIKYAYDPRMDVMTMKHQLLFGYFFAFNFGFIPNTQAEDGEPVDVVIYSNEACISRALIECRVAGLNWRSKEKMGRHYATTESSLFPQE